MVSEAVKSEIHDYLLKSSFNKKNTLTENTLIFKEGILDSMGLLSLLTFLEEKYHIQTRDTDLIDENFESINAISNFVARKSAP